MKKGFYKTIVYIVYIIILIFIFNSGKKVYANDTDKLIEESKNGRSRNIKSILKELELIKDENVIDAVIKYVFVKSNDSTIETI